MNALELIDISITPPGATAPLFPPVTLTIPAGEVLAVMGPSGVGKSTLIDFVGGHLGAGFRASGRVVLDGRDVTQLVPERRGIGILFQDPMLFPHLSVGENLAFGLTRRVARRSERRARVEAALARAGLDGLYDRDPATLSGGQRARAALMRSLLAEPGALLLDEPFAGLDGETRRDFRSFVFAHVKEHVIPVMMVTHDADDAEAAGTRQVVLRHE